MAVRKVRCPECGAESPWRPFCSERCKQIDLGCWATGGYVIPGPSGNEEADIPGLDFPDSEAR